MSTLFSGHYLRNRSTLDIGVLGYIGIPVVQHKEHSPEVWSIPPVTPCIYTGWCTKCHTIDCAHNAFLLLQKYLTSGTELILIGWRIVPNEEHVQCDHRFASQPLANEPLHS